LIGFAIGMPVRLPAAGAEVQEKPDVEFRTQIDQGKGNMPPFGSGLNQKQINQQIGYARELGYTHATGTQH